MIDLDFKRSYFFYAVIALVLFSEHTSYGFTNQSDTDYKMTEYGYSFATGCYVAYIIESFNIKDEEQANLLRQRGLDVCEPKAVEYDKWIHQRTN